MDTDSDAYSATDSPIPLTRAANDRRLRQAINYLHAEGGSDPAPLFVDRVQKIDDAIIQEYPELGLDYNPRLYARLQSMVDEVQDDFQRIREEVVSEEYSTDDDEDEDEDDGESVDYDVPVPEEVLYRNLSVGSMPAVTRNTLRDKGKGRAQEAREPDVPLAEVRKRQWIYGGPHNEVEEWFKELPPSLPFGETLYMQEWESMKIDYDLRESAKKASDGDYTAVKTSVPYGAPEASSRFQQRDFFDSGSRFKLPHVSPIDRARFGFQVSPLEGLVRDFNEGSYAHARQKDYAPRIFLTKIDVNSPQNQTIAAGTAIGKAKAAVIDITSSSDSESSEDDSFEEEYTSPEPPAVSRARYTTPPASIIPKARTPSAPKRPVSSRFGTIDPKVLASVRKYSQKATASTSTPTPSNSPTARKIATARPKAATRKTYTELDPVTGEVIGKRPAKKAASKSAAKKKAQQLSHVEVPAATSPSTKRKAGRPPKSPSSLPPPALSTRRAISKRKWEEDEDGTYIEALPSRPSRMAKTVAFTELEGIAEEEDDDDVVETPTRPRSKRVAAGHEKVQRGALRSGTRLNRRAK